MLSSFFCTDVGLCGWPCVDVVSPLLTSGGEKLTRESLLTLSTRSLESGLGVLYEQILARAVRDFDASEDCLLSRFCFCASVAAIV